MLYDVQADPGEDHNLADRHPDLVAALRRELDTLWKPQVAGQ